MSGNTVAREYLVTVRIRKEGAMPSPTDPIEAIPMIAYDPHEALWQTFIWLSSRLGGMDGFSIDCVSVGPNVPTMIERTTQLLREIALRLMPSEGRAS